MLRRQVIKQLITAAALPWLARVVRVPSASAASIAQKLRRRCRPGGADWPTVTDWDELSQATKGRLVRPESPFSRCGSAEQSAACREALSNLKNPFYFGDHSALTQTSGWVGAWTSQPSVYAVAAESTADVVAAVKFARKHSLRLVVKGGGHSYQGTSCSADSLLIWTRRMNAVVVHDDFLPSACPAGSPPQPAVSVAAGAMWIDAYSAVTTGAGRYVQGGGCTSVGVPGLIQGGGFGSFSKKFGTAAAGLLEAEIVTADGELRLANAWQHADLFWAIKGGGGGTFGVITRVTLRTRELPDNFGAVFGAIHASSDGAYRALISQALKFYAAALFNPHRGEQMTFRSDNTLRISMVFQGLTQQEAAMAWAPFEEWVQANRQLEFTQELKVLSMPARHFWDAEFFKKNAARMIVTDDRAGAPQHHFAWAGDQAQVAWQIHGYQSAWLPADLLAADRVETLAEALFACTRRWELGVHFNKGLAGAPVEELEAARNTSMHPAVLNAFALAIIGANGPPAFPGMPDGAPLSSPEAVADAARVDEAVHELQRIAPAGGSYVAESDYFERHWQSAFWGSNYPQLARVKQKYDPDGLFFVHHGVGSEAWSADGFTPLTPKPTA